MHLQHDTHTVFFVSLVKILTTTLTHALAFSPPVHVPKYAKSWVGSLGKKACTCRN